MCWLLPLLLFLYSTMYSTQIIKPTSILPKARGKMTATTSPMTMHTTSLITLHLILTALLCCRPELLPSPPPCQYPLYCCNDKVDDKTVLFVNSTESGAESCPTSGPPPNFTPDPHHSVCHTLDEYASCPSYYFQKAQVINFMQGKHYLSRSLIINGQGQGPMDNEQKHMLQVQPYPSNGTIDIVCNSTNASITLENAHFTLKALSLTDCGGGSYALNVSNVSRLTIEGITLLGRGAIKVEKSHGRINISNGRFSNLNGSCKYPSILNIVFEDNIHCSFDKTCHSCNTSLWLEHVTFENNTCASIHVKLSQLRYSVNTTMKRVVTSGNTLNKNTAYKEDILFFFRLSNTIIIDIDNCSFMGSNSAMKGLFLQESDEQESLDFNSINNVNQINITNSEVSGYMNGSIEMEFLNQAYKDIQPRIYLENVTISNAYTNYECWSVFVILYTSSDTQNRIVLNNVTFKNNVAGSSHCSGVLGSVAFFSFAHNATLINCTFQNNTGTALTVVGTQVTFDGSTSFINNTGVRGGAVALYAGGNIIPTDGATVLFHNNSAIDVGGAVYVSPCKYKADKLSEYYDQKCFIEKQLNASSSTFTFNFINNNAKNGGDAIYGAMLSRCFVDVNYTELGYKYLELVSNLNFSHPQKMSLISSEPSRVCVCSNNTVQCNRMPNRKSVYPGQLFEVEAALVGDMNGTTNGVIHAKLLGDEVTLGDILQNVQQASLTNCTKLTYSISSRNVTSSTFLTLSPTQTLTNSQEEIEVESTTYFEKSIQLLPCPLGFSLLKDVSECGCDPKLSSINITCNITSLEFSTNGKDWIGMKYLDNIMYYSKSCPCNYCKEKFLSVHLQLNDTPGQESLDQDVQCAYSRTGVLCGGCPVNLSLALGSNRCLPGCTDNYLSLVIAFALAGVALVFFIKVLNLTITVGTINGIAFYANIIAVDPSLFFPPESHVRTHFTPIISWINLDFGIETCFLKGMDGYTKVWLQFVFPMYVLILALLIVVISHYSMTASRIFGKNAVPVLATLIMLTYAKFLRTVSYAISSVQLQSLNPSNETVSVWFYDGNLEFLKGKHIPLFIFSLALVLLVLLPLTIVMLCSQWLQKITHVYGLQWVARLSPFFDALTGPCKSQHRYWIGVLLLARCVLIIIYASARQTRVPTELAFVSISSTLLMVGVGFIYKKVYIALLEYASLANLCILSTGTLYIKDISGNQEALAGASVGIASAQFIVVVLFHAWVELRQPARDLWLKINRRNEERMPLPIAIDRPEVRPGNAYHPLLGSSHESVPSKMVNVGSSHFPVASFSKYREPVLEHLDLDHSVQ